ncbi:MAG: ECF transporter S component [Solirubrobacterales bacterium]|nr:ECF transporter S component [Solirubrobacterales bacterium]
MISVIVLLVSLGAGMLWYERSRPPSQIVALVAVLAALAVAGRIVLAPIPNVVATTDIVIIAGYVLGPAPGFAVGALGGLVSNFWLGQGVWTPWQMVAWGMCGIGGAAFFQLTRGRVNRWSLAAFCGVAGLVFGAWMNLETMVSFGGEMSLDRYLALEVRAIPFDIAHMTGNIIFALAAGPAMVAALSRFRERFQWRRADPERSGTGGSGSPFTGAAGATMIALAALLFAFAGGPASRAEAAYTGQATRAATWLKTQQNTDGGFSSIPGSTSSVNITTRAMFALAATGTNPLDVKTNATPYGYLVNHRKQITDASDIALTILAMKTVGQNPRDFKGRNLIEALRNRRGNGSFGNDVNVTAFAVLAFRSVGGKKDAKYSLKWLYKAQNDNGGWGISKGSNSDADSTGASLMAITGKKAANRAIDFLDGIQKKSGGFENSGNVNAQSTGLVMQGLVAQGKGVNYLKKNGNSAADYLLSVQQEDGSIYYAKDNDTTRVWVTADGTTALAGKPLPITAPVREKDTNPGNNSGGATPGTGGTSTGGTSTGGTTLPAGSLAGSTPAPSTGVGGNSGVVGDGNSGNDGSGNNGSGNGGQGTGNGDNSTGTSTTTVPPTDTTFPLVPEAPSDAVLAASEAGPQPSPLVAILIALGVSGVLCGGTILLGRRFRW